MNYARTVTYSDEIKTVVNKRIRHVFPVDINITYPLVFNSFPGFIHYSLHIFY